MREPGVALVGFIYSNVTKPDENARGIGVEMSHDQNLNLPSRSCGSLEHWRSRRHRAWQAQKPPPFLSSSLLLPLCTSVGCVLLASDSVWPRSLAPPPTRTCLDGFRLRRAEGLVSVPPSFSILQLPPTNKQTRIKEHTSPDLTSTYSSYGIDTFIYLFIKTDKLCGNRRPPHQSWGLINLTSSWASSEASCPVLLQGSRFFLINHTFVKSNWNSSNFGSHSRVGPGCLFKPSFSTARAGRCSRERSKKTRSWWPKRAPPAAQSQSGPDCFQVINGSNHQSSQRLIAADFIGQNWLCSWIAPLCFHGRYWL